jgi:dUTP pyrophosphatase
MKVKIKKLSEKAVLPKYAKEGDAGLDLVAVDRKVFTSGIASGEPEYIEYDTGLAIEIPEGYVGMVFPRSSISNKELFLTNHVGIIDSSYRGSIKLRFKPTGDAWAIEDFGDYVGFYATAEDELRDYSFDLECYNVGDRIAQLIIMPIPNIEFEEVEELTETERNEGGFGSTN